MVFYVYVRDLQQFALTLQNLPKPVQLMNQFAVWRARHRILTSSTSILYSYTEVCVRCWSEAIVRKTNGHVPVSALAPKSTASPPTPNKSKPNAGISPLSKAKLSTQYISQLKSLQDLRECGVLSETEFEEQRRFALNYIRSLNNKDDWERGNSLPVSQFGPEPWLSTLLCATVLWYDLHKWSFEKWCHVTGCVITQMWLL